MIFSISVWVNGSVGASPTLDTFNTFARLLFTHFRSSQNLKNDLIRSSFFKDVAGASFRFSADALKSKGPTRPLETSQVLEYIDKPTGLSFFTAESQYQKYEVDLGDVRTV